MASARMQWFPMAGCKVNNHQNRTDIWVFRLNTVVYSDPFSVNYNGVHWMDIVNAVWFTSESPFNKLNYSKFDCVKMLNSLTWGWKRNRSQKQKSSQHFLVFLSRFSTFNGFWKTIWPKDVNLPKNWPSNWIKMNCIRFGCKLLTDFLLKQIDYPPNPLTCPKEGF